MFLLIFLIKIVRTLPFFEKRLLINLIILRLHLHTISGSQNVVKPNKSFYKKYAFQVSCSYVHLLESYAWKNVMQKHNVNFILDKS